MTESPFFSVIIPSYNRGHMIAETVQSVLDQVETDFELIVVDDGSTDSTQQVVESIADPRVRYLFQNNAERAAARNHGVKAAFGRFITFLDSDDRFYPHHLRLAKQFLLENDIPFYYQRTNLVDENGKILKRPPTLEDNLNLMLVKRGNFMNCMGMFIKREVLVENPFCEDRTLTGSEDYELWLRLAARIKMTGSSEATSALVVHSDRSVFNFNSEKLIKRKEKMLQNLADDSEFMQAFGSYFNIIQSGAYSYISLHLPINRQTATLRFRYWLKAVKASPGFVFSRRSLVIIRQIALGY